jgi:hypothetical protein
LQSLDHAFYQTIQRFCWLTELSYPHGYSNTLYFSLSLSDTRSPSLSLDLDLSGSLAVSLSLSQSLNLATDRSLNHCFDNAIKLAGEIKVDDQLISTLSAMKVDLQNLLKQGVFDSDLELWQGLFQERYLQLQQACISHRDLGYDWQFTQEDVQCLEKYIETNQLLVDCLNSECSLSPEVRAELEKNLLVENFDEQP